MANVGDLFINVRAKTCRKVVLAIAGKTAARSLSIGRDFGDPYDGSNELVYRSTVTATFAGG